MRRVRAGSAPKGACDNRYVYCWNHDPPAYPEIVRRDIAETDAVFGRLVKHFSVPAIMSRSDTVQAVCRCGLQGKVAITELGAIQTWNRRVITHFQKHPTLWARKLAVAARWAIDAKQTLDCRISPERLGRILTAMANKIDAQSLPRNETAGGETIHLIERKLIAAYEAKHGVIQS